jgi:hypothetical protein
VIARTIATAARGQRQQVLSYLRYWYKADVVQCRSTNTDAAFAAEAACDAEGGEGACEHAERADASMCSAGREEDDESGCDKERIAAARWHERAHAIAQSVCSALDILITTDPCAEEPQSAAAPRHRPEADAASRYADVR